MIMMMIIMIIPSASLGKIISVNRLTPSLYINIYNQYNNDNDDDNEIIIPSSKIKRFWSFISM